MSAPDGDNLLIYMPTCPCLSCEAYRASNGYATLTHIGLDCPSCQHMPHAGDCDECLCNYDPAEVTP